MSYECRLTIVNDGRSDSVIKIWPAAIKEGKVWMNRVAHKEWWERVKQNLHRYAAKGTFVPEPMPYHHDGNPLANITLKEDQIPQVRLDGWELPELPPEDKTPILPNSAGNMLDMNKRIDGLEKNVGELVSAVTKLITATHQPIVMNSREPAKPQTQSDDLGPSVVPKFTCCGEKFKNGTGLAAHKRFKHKGMIAKVAEAVFGKEE